MPPCTALEKPRCVSPGVKRTTTFLPTRSGAQLSPPGLSVPQTKHARERKTGSLIGLTINTKFVATDERPYRRPMSRWAIVFFLSTTLPACATPAWALPESAAGRRAIRGSTVEVAHESEELR